MGAIHGMLGESLAVLYLLVAAGSYLRRRQGGLPAWLTGIAHAFLAIQVVIGVALFVRAPNIITWWHPVVGLLALAALGLAVPLRSRLGRANATAVTALLVAILVLIAVVIARAR
uniref:Cytochrome b561 domain-containing protein n=2 Tax=Thermorudis TaxID=1649508 RepID=A0A7C2W8A2_9BACT